MAGEEEEKTEEPTSKKIEDAKKEGNVPKSMEVTGAAILLFGTVYLLFFSSFSLLEIKKLMLFSSKPPLFLIMKNFLNFILAKPKKFYL